MLQEPRALLGLVKRDDIALFDGGGADAVFDGCVVDGRTEDSKGGG